MSVDFNFVGGGGGGKKSKLYTFQARDKNK